MVQCAVRNKAGYDKLCSKKTGLGVVQSGVGNGTGSEWYTVLVGRETSLGVVPCALSINARCGTKSGCGTKSAVRNKAGCGVQSEVKKQNWMRYSVQ